MISVLLDLNILGRGYAADVTRAGIFRSTESFVRAMRLRTDITLRFSANANWASELLLLAYDRASDGALAPRVVRFWEQPSIADADATALIAHVVGEEAAGRVARRDRAQLTLLNATARWIASPSTFDVVHSLRTPLGPPERTPARVRALTIHDLIPLLHPEWMYPNAEAELRTTVGSILDRDFAFCNSGATAKDLHEVLHLPHDRIFVTPLAADHDLFYREETLTKIDAVKARYHIPPGPYLLSVCTLEPRKNLPQLLRSFERMLRRPECTGVHLVLVGSIGWKTETLFAMLNANAELAARVVVTGRAADADLAALYSGARAFVYPSLYEGFGLPVLEAMQCGTPVITSDSSSLPEVVGDAAITVPAADAEALTEALLGVVSNDALAADLSRRGRERAAMFSWDRSVEETLRAYATMLART